MMKKLLSVICILGIILMMPTGVSAENMTVATEVFQEENLPAWMPERKLLGNIEITEEDFETPPALFSAEDDGTIGGVDPTENYGYQQMELKGEAYKEAYLALARTMEAGAEKAEVDTVFEAWDIYMILEAVISDFPQFFWVSNCTGGWMSAGDVKEKTVFLPIYAEAVKNNPEAAAEFEEWAETILDKSGVTMGMSDYDKSLMLHDELAARITYHQEAYEEYMAAEEILDEEEKAAEMARLDALYPNIHTAYGALVEGKAVCDGYAKAYAYLLHKVGIYSHVAVGTGNGGGHAWNLVRLDGEWCYTDLTWDDQDEVFYDYFNMTLEQLKESGHEFFWYLYTMPTATDTAHSYFVRNGGIMTEDNEANLNNIVEQLKKSAYARVYVDGIHVTKQEIWDLFQEKISEIKGKIGIAGRVSYGYHSETRHEMHLQLWRDILHPVRNLSVEVASIANREVEVVFGYYDENGVLLAMDKKPCSLKEGSILNVKAPHPKVNYHTVRYFVWDSVEGLQPIYKPAEMEY